MVKYCTQPGCGLHRVWLPLDSQSRQDTPDPATVKINHPNPTGHAFNVHTYLHIKRDVAPEQPTKTMAPPAPPAAPQPPPTPATGGNSPMAAAMENLRAIANDCPTFSVHITMERLSRLLYSYMRDVDFNACRDAAPVMPKPTLATSNNRQRQRRPPRQPFKHTKDAMHHIRKNIKMKKQTLSPFVNRINSALCSNVNKFQNCEQETC
jgi:hypothetical protein